MNGLLVRKNKSLSAQFGSYLLRNITFPSTYISTGAFVPLTSDDADKLGLQTEWNDQTGFSIKNKLNR